MSDEIKVGDLFNLPVKVIHPVTETKGGWPIVSASLVGNSISGQIATLTISQGPHSGTSKYLDVDLAFKMAQASELAINNHDRLVEENKRLQEALEQAKAMSIESINREDLVILISTGFRHAEIKGSFEIDDLYAAFNSMVYKRKKLLSELGGE
ncbi:hypothetical protein ACR0WA_000609 [Vibrio cholerae]